MLRASLCYAEVKLVPRAKTALRDDEFLELWEREKRDNAEALRAESRRAGKRRRVKK
jgi:hypothetical protein